MKGLSGESSRTSTSAVAQSFAEDIFIEILLRVPAKSLMRFKCVSKRWQSLISDPGFARSHLQRLKSGDIISSQRIFKTRPVETKNYEALDRGIGGDDDRAMVRFHGPSIDVRSCDPRLVGSCDGLVCLSVSDGFLLYNPTTKESRKLPGSDLLRIDELIYGFGYDSHSDDYKIVQRKGPEYWLDGSGECEVVRFSLKSLSWRRAQARLESHLSLFREEGGVYWNGALHWVFIDQSKEKFANLIISFDLSEEKFEQVLSFPKIHDNIRFNGLGIHGANLFMYHSTYDCVQVWITSEYRKGGSWAKLFCVSTKGIPTVGIPGYDYWQKIPIAYTRSGKIVFKAALSQMILFNPEDNTYKDYPIQNGRNLNSVIYEETLVSPAIKNLELEPFKSCTGGFGLNIFSLSYLFWEIWPS